MALKGLKVIELAGLAPAPFCGMILAEFGATVIRVDKMGGFDMDCLGNGKKSIKLNLKHPSGVAIFRKMCKSSDVLLEPFRKGVMEKLGLGPNILLADNPKLIYARLTGYSQSGPFSNMAGHDINYVAVSGLLSLLGRKNDKPTPPVNLIADFGGGGLMCALGIIIGLLERTTSGQGQVIDANMVEGAAYLGSWLFRSQHLPIWGKPRGENWLDSGAHFYDTYETKDGKHMAVGAIEPQFYSQLLKGLDIPESTLPQMGDFERKQNVLAKKFLEKTQSEWCKIFNYTDACVTPVLSLEEAQSHIHNKERQSFVTGIDGSTIAPVPAPRFSRTPASSLAHIENPDPGEHTAEILLALNYSQKEIMALEKENIIEIHEPKSKL